MRLGRHVIFLATLLLLFVSSALADNVSMKDVGEKDFTHELITQHRGIAFSDFDAGSRFSTHDQVPIEIGTVERWRVDGHKDWHHWDDRDQDPVRTSTVPQPASIFLLGTGLLGVISLRKRVR